MNKTNQPRMLRMKQLTNYTSLSRAYIYEKIGKGTFPSGHLISPGIRAWQKLEVDDWLDKRIEK
jgi:predicted DNA-binding transcriptional regulator AlpA